MNPGGGDGLSQTSVALSILCRPANPDGSNG